MYLLKCNNSYEQKVIELLLNKFANFTNEPQRAYFSILSITLSDKKIFIVLEKNKLVFDLPISANNLFQKIIDLLKDHSVVFSDIKYFPYRQKLFYKNQTLSLSNIHNLIFQQLLLNLDLGVDKKSLYSLAWPNDKNVMPNKLDTHLTNLKNLILETLNFRITFASQLGRIKLIN